MSRGAWSSRYGFYMVAVGSAFGLGNLWRFPFVVGHHGGGAFVLAYIFAAMLVGLPLLIAELLIGKTYRQSMDRGLKELFKQSKQSRPYRVLGIWIGRLSLLASVLMLAYYAVISGWVLFFLGAFIKASFLNRPLHPTEAFQYLMNNGTVQIFNTFFHIFLAGLIVTKGIREGIERWVQFLIPLFLILVGILLFQSLSLPGRAEALRFLLYPNFSRVSLATWIRVMGHVCFTLSLGMGVMVVFGSYLQPTSPVPRMAVRVMFADTLLSLSAGVLIFPIVISAGYDTRMLGPSLLFETVPLLFAQHGLGTFFGVAFFLCLYTAALVASMGLLEASVAHFMDRQEKLRAQATRKATAIVFLLSIVPALSSTVFSDIKIYNRGLLESIDGFIVTGLLPLVALLTAFVVGFCMKRESIEKEFLGETGSTSVRMYSSWLFAIRWLVPAFIFIGWICMLFSNS